MLAQIDWELAVFSQAFSVLEVVGLVLLVVILSEPIWDIVAGRYGPKGKT